MNLKNSIACQIFFRRNELKLTQSELGRLAGVSQQQIAKLENSNSNPSLATLEKIAKILKCNLVIKLVDKSVVRLTLDIDK